MLILLEVLHKLHAWGARDQAEDIVCRKQCKVDAYQRTSQLEEVRTTYIDILYVHWWDWETSIEEMMNGLHILVQQGKVLYLVEC